MPFPLDAEIVRALRRRAERDRRRRGEEPDPRDARHGRALRADRRARSSSASATRTARRCCRRRGRSTPTRSPPALRHAAARRGCDDAAGAARPADRGPPADPARATLARRSSARAARTTRSTEAPDGTLVGAGIGCHTMVMLMDPSASATSPASRRWATRARSGSASRRSSSATTSSRTSATARSSTPASLAIRGRRRRRRQHHLQAALQRHRRDDRRPGCRGPDERARRSRAARCRGRRADHDHDRRAARVPPASRCPSGVEVRTARRIVEAQRELARRSPGVHRADPRPAVRGRAAARPQARQRRRRRRTGCVINERVCEGCGDCGDEVELPVGPAGRDRVRAQDADRPDDLQQGLLVPRGRLPVVHDGDRRRRAAERLGPTHPTACRRATCPSPSGRSSTARLRDPDVGHRRHRRRHRQPDRSAWRRCSTGCHVARPRPDRPLAEGRPGRQRPAPQRRRRRQARTRPRPATVDVLLGFDLLVGAGDAHLHGADPDRTVVVAVRTATPTGVMVRHPDTALSRRVGCARGSTR